MADQPGVPLFRSAHALVESGTVDWAAEGLSIGPCVDGYEVFIDGRRVAVFRLDPILAETDATLAVADARARYGV